MYNVSINENKIQKSCKIKFENNAFKELDNKLVIVKLLTYIIYDYFFKLAVFILFVIGLRPSLRVLRDSEAEPA